MTIMPPTDTHSNTPAGATAIALSESFQGRIDSPNDVDYFRVRVDSPGTLTIRTTGTADPDIAVFDGAGNEVPGVSGSWIGSITQDILDRGSDLLVRFSGGNAGAEYTGSVTLDQTPQTSPDLVVVSPSVSDSNPAAGASFTLSATASNAGGGESAATTLRYYRSTDGTITTSDTAVGTDAVAGLAASGSDSQSVELVAPSAPGTYHYGACVDAVAGESDTANNCSTAVQVTVPSPERPDLMVVSPSVSNNSPIVGSQFTLSAMVNNAGGGESAASTLRYFRSADSTITTSDTEVGTNAVAGLAPSGSGSQSVDLTAPAAPGPYYYGACVDAVAGESNTANNCSTAVQVTVPVPERPDLMVVSSSVSNHSPTAGSQFTLSATVQNDGNGESAATTLRYYRSTDATITTSDTAVGTDAVAGVAASGSDSHSVELVAPSAPGPYYYGVCVETVAGESDTTNNCSIAVQITVLLTDTQIQGSPDLEVGTPTVSDTSPETEASFTLSATVSNAGAGESAATTLRYYRSTDVTITRSDTAVGTDAVGALGASGTSAQSISLTAPATAGAYYYGACVDAVTDESDTTDNCSASVKVDVEAPKYPDLEVGTPTVDESSPETGASFTLSTTVNNVGGGDTAATTLRYYRSTDATITTSDTAVGTEAVAGLAASGSSSKSVDMTAPANPGRYYYGACVDAVAGESDTTNNCSASVQVTVPEPVHPDLAIGAPSVSNSSPVTGASFTLSATVRNDGAGDAAATTVRYYRSTDATITTSDTEVGTEAVAELTASGSSSKSVDLTAPASPGPYYYGACVDVVAGESDTTNNCSTSVEVIVLATEQEIQGQPDLTVGTPTVSDSGPETGVSFTLSATVSNTGDGESVATTLRYYRSTDATITTSDTAEGTDAVGALSASGSSAESISVTAPATAGEYYYGACVDAVTDESDTTDNCSASVKVDVEAPKYPDLEVGTPTVSDSGPETGVSFTLSATVSNTGDGESVATTLRYYRSTDATITTSDTAEGTGAVGVLSASGSSAESISVTAPATAGVYYYGACVDAVTDESDTTDNCSASVKVDVEAPKYPDLEVGTPTVSDSGLETGASFTLSATVSNTGDGESVATTLRYYRSTDATITTSDTAEGTGAVGALSASGSSAESISVTAPATMGAYYYGACVDAVTDESDTTDNCSASVKVDVEAPKYPDLEVGTPTVDESSPETGASFTLSATVSNTGDGESVATTLRYYRSTDATITTSDTAEGTDAVGVLSASGSSAQSIELTAPATAGVYYYGACVDAVTDESDTTDNCSASVKVDVEAPKYPDLEVGTPTVDESSPETGASFTLSTTVNNVGGGDTAATTLRYYRSTDATITTSDTAVGTEAVAGLAASGSSSKSVDMTAPANPGRYYYGACVDAVAGESDTTNNCSASVQVTVPEPVHPDLAIGAPSVSNSSPVTGASFTLSATVRNDGAGDAAATTVRYYRSTDATITTSDTEVGTEAVAELTASGSSSKSVDLTAPASPGPYYYGACVDVVAGESDTTNNCSTSVEVIVLATEQEIQGQPDLTVGTPTVSDSGPETGVSFTLSATVSNTGDGESVATTLRYYRSTDATITTSDTAEGTDAVGALSASGSSAESISLTAPATAGVYYYGACVDAVTDESDTTDNCSASVKVDVEAPKYPDLEVGTPTVSDSGPETGASFTLSATVSNTGDGESVATTLRYYRSTDATITTSDTAEGTGAVGALSASGSSAESISVTAPATMGAYYYGACVDAVTDESDTTDNCSASVKVDVEAPKYPDLEVGTPTVDESSPETGASFTLSATVSNTGDGESVATTLRYYRSTDATITTSDTAEGTGAVGALSASGSSAESISLTAPATAGVYYYGACVDAVTDESDTTDNCSASVKVDVEAPKYPDLEVGTPTVSDSGPETGVSFTLSATVSNTGDGESVATTLRYYRSTDATITTSDTAEGTDAVGALSASGSSAESISLTAPATAGVYYYGACVDAVTDESDTTDNCSASVKVDVEAPKYPDLTVGTPTVSDSGPETGVNFTLSATVSNTGDGESVATTLRYYRSTDATITTSDTAEGTGAVGVLSASGSSAESISVTAPATAGVYYYGACVDAVTDESDTTDNCSASVKVDVEAPKYPDLEVGTPTVDATSPGTGATFTLSATVSNTGDGESVATTLRYYRSTDATITTSDTAEGTGAVGALSASGSSAESISLTAPATMGAYYYGACVDAVTDESDTTDNCSASVKVDVEAPKYPDLEVGTPTVNESSPETGATFTLSATVSNTGDGESVATTLRYYRSTDATITTSDTAEGTGAVGALSASATSAQSIELTAPATAGVYYYGACVDAVTDESDTTDNCSASVKVDVEAPKYPDLEVGTPTVDATSPGTGATFTLSATVSNTGDGESVATTLRYYRSTDATITTSDTAEGTDAVGALSASGSSAESISVTAPATAGEYYYGACVDTVTEESDTTNNCSGSVTVTVTETEQSGLSVKVTAEDDMEWAPVGDTVDLMARVLDEEGDKVSDATVSWSSSNRAVATVNSSGVMTAVGVGSATLTAMATVSSSSTQSVTAKSRVSGGAVVNAAETVSDSIDIQVVKRASRIEVSPTSLSFDEAGEGWVGSLKSVTATVYDANDNEMQPTYWSWSSSDEDVVTVRPFGAGEAFVQAVWIGSATLTVTANASATVTVSIAVGVTLPSGRVQLEPRSLTFDALGDTKSVTVRIFDENGEEDEDATWNYFQFFTPSTGGRIGTGSLNVTRMDGGLRVTANQTGTANVEVFARVHSYGLTVTVTQKPASLEVSPDSASLAVGGTSKLTAKIKDSNGHSTQLASGDQEGLVVSWTTSNSAVVSVDGADDSTQGETGATATVTGVAAGNATITASWGTGSARVTDTATVTVTASN